MKSNSKTILPILSIDSPCPMTWEEMTGDSRVRTCAQCDRTIQNLAEMTRAEIAQLLVESAGTRLCARLTHSSDGGVLTKDSPASRPSRVRYISRVAGIALGAALTLPPAGAQAPARPSQSASKPHQT